MAPIPAATSTSMDADCDWPPWWLAGAWKPWVTRKATSENQNTTFKTTAEPMPWVPSAKPASALVTPDWVRSR